MDWYFAPLGTDDSQKVNNGAVVLKDFPEFTTYGVISGQSLRTNSTQLKHAGTYICTIMGTDPGRKSTTKKHSAQVTVLGESLN